MSAQDDRGAPSPALPSAMVSKNALRRTALLLVAPLAAYAVVRPLVSSDALGLAIAAAIPILYSIALPLIKRQIDYLAGLSALGFSLACLVSVLTGGSSLPLKLHEAMITFGIGLVLLVTALIRRPIPIARLLRVPSPDAQIDGSLGGMVGGFLVLHALLHFALAVSLPTSSYLVAGRVINWATTVLGVLGLAAYLRRMRATRKQPRA